MAHRSLIRNASGRRRGGGGGIIVGGGGLTQRLYLPFDTPGHDTLRASRYKVFGHAFSPPDHRIAPNAANYGNRIQDAGSPDLYDNSFGAWMPPKGTSIPTGSSGGTSLWPNRGKRWRDHPRRRADPTTPTTTALVKDRETEILYAYGAGFDGYFVEGLYTAAGPELEYYTAVENLGLVGKFDLLPMPDYSSPNLLAWSSQQTADYLTKLITRPAQYKINGKAQVAVFYPENKPLSHWQGVHTILNAAGTPVEFTFCYVNGAVYGTGNRADQYKTVAVRHGNWGGRDPRFITQQLGPMAYANDTQSGLTPGRGLGYICAADERPQEGNYWENKLTEGLRTSWGIACDGNGQISPFSSPGPARNDWVQGITMTDWSEHSSLAPSQNHGDCLLDLSWYWLIKYKTGSFPTIIRDGLYLAHRTQFSNQASMTYTSPSFQPSNRKLQTLRTGSSSSFTPAQDLIEVLVFATSPCTVELTVNGVTLTKSCAAGLTVWNDTPLQAAAVGGISAVMKRSGSAVPGTAITSPWAVSHTNYSQDMNMRVGSSLRGWTPTTPDWIPDQSWKPIT